MRKRNETETIVKLKCPNDKCNMYFSRRVKITVYTNQRGDVIETSAQVM